MSLAEVRIANNSQTYQAFTICWTLYFHNIFVRCYPYFISEEMGAQLSNLSKITEFISSEVRNMGAGRAG